MHALKLLARLAGYLGRRIDGELAPLHSDKHCGMTIQIQAYKYFCLHHLLFKYTGQNVLR